MVLLLYFAVLPCDAGAAGRARAGARAGRQALYLSAARRLRNDRHPGHRPRSAPSSRTAPRGWLGLPVQRWRRLTQAGFFLLFVLAPVFDIFRLDLNLGHLILFGFDWTLGLDDFAAGRIVHRRGLAEHRAARLPAAAGDRRHGALRRLEMGPPVLRLAVPAFLDRRNPQPDAAPRDRQAEPVGQEAAAGAQPRRQRNPPRRALVVRRAAADHRLRDAVGGGAADLPAAAGRDLRQPLARHADAQPGHFPDCRQHRLLRRIHVRAPPVLPLCLRGRAVPEPGLDGQRQGDGDRLQPRARQAIAPAATRPATMSARCG